MVSAYVLILTEVGRAAAVAKSVAQIAGVIESHYVIGPYDVIARAEMENLDRLGHEIVARIQQVDGVDRTVTCPVVSW